MADKNQKNTNKKDSGKKDSKKKSSSGGLLGSIFTPRPQPKTTQQSIPYITTYENGIIQVAEDKFSKSYRIEDTNFSIADQNVQESMFWDYETLLNGFDDTMTAQVTVFNRSFDPELVKNQILLKPKNDAYNMYRDEYNQMLLNKMSEGRNNLRQEKYLTVTVTAQNVEDAEILFKRLDDDIAEKILKLNRSDTKPMTRDERLAVLYDIYHNDVNFPFASKVKRLMKGGEDDVELDFARLAAAGMDSKDLIAPNYISFSSNHFRVGEMFAKACFLDNLPSFMNARALTNITSLPCNMLTSVIYRPIPNEEAAIMVKRQITSINENIIRQQQKAAKNNYSQDILPGDLRLALDEAERLRNDMQQRNQKLFKVTLVMTIFAETKEELDQRFESLKSLCVSELATCKCLDWQQEAGFRSCLPLGKLDVNIDRVLNTEASAVFIPFSVKEIFQEKGTYYGLNAISKNLILYDRMSADNYNGLIFGKPGSGKSFIAKQEIVNTLFRTTDDIFIIDPEGEYNPMVEAFGGQSIRIAVGSDTHINPLDMDVQFSDEDPVATKCDFLTAICETIVGHGNLDPIMVNLIHRCGRQIFQPYLDYMETQIRKKDKNGNRITCDREHMPTLVNFYHAMSSIEDPRAEYLAQSLEMYCTGTYDLFARQTNINTEARMVVYNIRDIPAGMKELALQICLNDIWNRIIENKKRNRRTWFYIDEFYLLTQTQSSAKFVEMVYKRARKWGGIPTGITQNVEYLLTSEDARTILNNCNFLLMMNQSQIDRAALADLYSISDSLQDYINDKPAGTGLMYNGSECIAFVNQFDRKTALYKIMSTKPGEFVNEPDAKAQANQGKLPGAVKR